MTHNDTASWEQMIVRTTISTKNKKQTADRHNEYYDTDHIDNINLYFHTNRSGKERMIGA